MEPAYPLNSGIAEKTTESVIKYLQMCCKTRMSRLVEEQNKETQEFHRSWEQKRLILENEHKMASALIHSEHIDPVNTEKLKVLYKEFAKKMGQYKQEKEMALKELDIKHLASRNDESQKAANWLTQAKSKANGEKVHNVPEVGVVKEEPALDGIPIIKETSPNVVSSNVASLMNSKNEGNILDDRIDTFDKSAVPLDMEEQTACTAAGSVPCQVAMNSETSELGAPILEFSSRKTERGDQIHSKGPNVVIKLKDEANTFISSNLSTTKEKCLVDGSSLKENNQSNNGQERNSRSTQSGKEPLIKVFKEKCDNRMKTLVQKHEKEIQELKRLWDQKLELLEKSHELNAAFTTLMQRHSVRVEEPVVVNNEFADEMKNYKHQKEMSFKDLEQKQLAEMSEEYKKAAHWLSEASADRADEESSLVGNPETSEDGNQNGPLNIHNTSGGADSFLASANPLPGRPLDQEKQASDDICTALRSEAIAHDKLFNEKILSGCNNVVEKEFGGANSIIPGKSPFPRQSLEICSSDQPAVSAMCDLTLPPNLDIQNNFSQPLSNNVSRDNNNQSSQNLAPQVELLSPEVQSTSPPVDNQTDLHQASGVVDEASSGRQPNQPHCADPPLHVVEDISNLLNCSVEQFGGDLKSCQPLPFRESPVGVNPEKSSPQETLIHSTLQSEANLPCQGSNNSDQRSLLSIVDLCITNCQHELERTSCEKDQLDKYYKDLSLRLKCEFAKEMEEMMAKMKSQYECNMQDAEKDFLLKKKESETMQNKVMMNKELSEAFRSTHLNPSFLTTTKLKQVMNSSFLEQFSQLPSLQLVPSSSSIVATSSSGIPSASQHDSVRPPPLQVGHQSEPLTSIPTRPLTVTSLTPIARNIGNQSIRSPAPHIRPFQPSASTSSPLLMSSHHSSQTTLPMTPNSLLQATPPRASPPVLSQHSQRIYPRTSFNQPMPYLQTPQMGPQGQNVRGNLPEISRLPPMSSLWSPPPAAAAAATQPSQPSSQTTA